MSAQAELDLYRVTDADQWVQPSGSIEQAWAAFHAANPHVYAQLVDLARLWVAKRPGRHLGIGMLFERLRWDLAMRTTGEPLKLNNNYRALYARLIMEREPDLTGLFETRRLRTEDR
jgi:hypothetical protein